jgi:hypothetical protein
MSVVVCGLSIIKYKLVSSANNLIVDSAIHQLINITNEFGKALDENKEVRVIFCDISKAFDRVWHRGLLKKLESIGIRGSLLESFEIFSPRCL